MIEIEGRVSDAINQVIAHNSLNYSEMIKYAGGVTASLANDLNIGQVILKTITPKRLNMLDAVQEDEIIFHEGTYIPEISIPLKFEIMGLGTVIVTTYAKDNNGFNELQTKLIKDLTNCIFTCISRVKFTELLNTACFSDQLTGAANLQSLFRYLEGLNRSDDLSKYAIVFSNIKDFKSINKKYDNTMADMVLKAFFKRLMDTNGADTFICRPGGDNIISVVPKTSLERFLKIILQSEYNCKGNNYEVITYSGIYEIKENDTYNDAITYASDALRICKSKFECYSYVLTNEDAEKVVKEKEIKQKFDAALINQEFEIYFQPKVNINNLTMCGAEALVRWVSDGKVIPPSEFIDFLEEEGLICQLDFYMLEHTCQILKDWIQRGINPVSISVNFSTNHIKYQETADRIINTVLRNGIDPSLIDIEITELTNYRDYDSFFNFANKLSASGFKLTMDDYGSGFSSTNILKKIHYDVIKLDKSIIDDIADPSSADYIIDLYTIRMLKALDREVIAEGVETKEQLEMLRRMGCDVIQGYFFDKPLPPEEFVNRLENPQYTK